MHSKQEILENIGETGESQEHSCPECGSPSRGTYCPNCGEQMETHPFSVKHYVKEIFHEFAVFDTKFFRTIPALLFKPGFLTVEYIAGRRKRYLAPARLYTLIAFFSFFALGYYLSHELQSLFQSTLASEGRSQIIFGTATGEKGLQLAETWLKFTIEVSPYVLLLCSTPAFALFLKLIYLKRRMLFAEHLVFSFHFYAFSLIVVIDSLLVQTNYGFYIAATIFLLYLYFALKKYYADRGFRLVARLLACSIAYLNIAVIAILLTLILASLIGYQLGELPEGKSIFKYTTPK
jgi:hypothetical protein